MNVNKKYIPGIYKHFPGQTDLAPKKKGTANTVP